MDVFSQLESLTVAADRQLGEGRHRLANVSYRYRMLVMMS